MATFLSLPYTAETECTRADLNQLSDVFLKDYQSLLEAALKPEIPTNREVPSSWLWIRNQIGLENKKSLLKTQSLLT